MFNQKNFIVLTVCLVILNRNLFSQIVVQGTVTDEESAAVQNALVELIDLADTTRQFSDYTNAQGRYEIQVDGTGVNDVYCENPGTFHLMQNYPNPFNPSTVIGYELDKPANILIEIYNILGQKIKTLFSGFHANGVGRVVWDATDYLGQGVSAGFYIYSLKAEGIRINKKMLLIDGNQGNARNSRSFITATDGLNQDGLTKRKSNQYLLRVTGDNIDPYQQKNLLLVSSMILDITVKKIALSDIDGNSYRIVKIGSQWWMAENLKVTKYRNGEAIANVKDNSEWTNQTVGAYCFYDNVANNIAPYGLLYNWFAVIDERNIAPAGWHVPSDEEWKQLEMHLGMSRSQADDEGWRGDDEGGKLKEAGTAHWHDPNTGATNESGFSALPGGYRANSNGYFTNMGYDAYFWSLTQRFSTYVWSRYLGYYGSEVGREYEYKLYGFSVRLVRDSM